MSKHPTEFTAEENRWFRMVQSHVYNKLQHGIEITQPLEKDMLGYIRQRDKFESNQRLRKRDLLKKWHKEALD